MRLAFGSRSEGSRNGVARASCIVLALSLSLAAEAEQGDAVSPESESAKAWTKRSPVFPTTPLSPYFDFKQKVHDRTGIGWTVNYSITDGHRVKNSFAVSNYSMIGS